MDERINKIFEGNRINKIIEETERLYTEWRLSPEMERKIPSLIEEKQFMYGTFAELIVKKCKENFAKIWYEQGMDICGAEIGKFLAQFDEHLGVKE